MSADLLQSWFRTWLNKQPNTRQFKTNDPRCCPVAMFLKSRGAPAPLVEAEAFSMDERASPVTVVQLKHGTYPDHPTVRRMPKWAERFVLTLDNEFGDADSVTPPIVKEVLDKVSKSL